ncbi:MAG: glycerate kinase [Victivallales bacterium]|nr:glycerate kinase [Victivallales bacterium]
MKIVVAPDSFKGTLRAVEVCEIWREALCKHLPGAEVICVPMSDGGEGALEAVSAATKAQLHVQKVRGPLGATVEASWAQLPDQRTAFVESAQACGLCLLKPDERNVLQASTFGVGQLLSSAMEAGARRLVIAIGGTATCDGGAGMLQALGVHFLDERGNELPPGGAALERLVRIDANHIAAALQETEIVIACDVTNPLCGPDGSAAVFAPQKGATPEQVAQLERAMLRYRDVLQAMGFADAGMCPGDGAAGGLGCALRLFGRGHACSGATLLAELARLPEHLSHADLLITGEGKSDAQTLHGKLPAVLAQMAHEKNVPVLLCSGDVEYSDELGALFDAVHTTVPTPAPLPELLAHARENLVAEATSIAKSLQMQGGPR